MPKGAPAFIGQTAKKAGAAVLKRFGKDKVHIIKSHHIWDVVTKADLMSEKLIVSAIRKKYPGHGIISEEGGRIKEGSEFFWLIDPIDGTANFASGVPLFGVMICLVHNGDVILSAIHLPATREFFFAQKGKGSYLNGRRIHCSREHDLAHSYGMASSSLRTRTGLFFKNIIKGKMDMLMLGALGSIAANASYVAAGKRDWIVQLVGGHHDFGPISLILKESGCKVTDTKGRPWRFGMLELVAANPALHRQLLSLTRGV